MIWAVVGSLGVWVMELSYIPQLLRLYRMKEAEEFSLLFPSLNLVGRFMVMGYMISINQPFLGLGFLAGILLRSTLLFQVLYYRRSRREEVFQKAVEEAPLPAATSPEDQEERASLVSGFSRLEMQPYSPGDAVLLAVPVQVPWGRE